MLRHLNGNNFGARAKGRKRKLDEEKEKADPSLLLEGKQIKTITMEHKNVLTLCYL